MTPNRLAFPVNDLNAKPHKFLLRHSPLPAAQSIGSEACGVDDLLLNAIVKA
jgi:hypothetical protein